MASDQGRWVIGDLRGGRNGADALTLLAENECIDAVNVDWWHAGFARKRNGSASQSLTGSTIAGKISALIRHVPGADETLAQLWAIDDGGVFAQLVPGPTWSAITLKDALTGNAWDVNGVSVNGFLFLAYKSAQNRLHCYDGSTVRRAGLPAATNAPTVANTGAGAYAATLRYYRIRWLRKSGAIVVNRSEASPSVSFTPSGGGTAARITQPTPPSEGETHWEVEVSQDDVTYTVLYGEARGGSIAIGTTTADDNIALATSATFPAAPLTGTYTLQKSYKFIAGADNRLLGYGSHDTTDKQDRLEFSPPIGALNAGDAERTDTTGGYYLDFDEHDSGEPSGLVGPVNGYWYLFKTKQLWEIRPTGEPTAPFEKRCISKSIGAIFHKAICLGEDAAGRQCVYFLSHVGPYRYGVNGLEYLGRKIEDLTLNAYAGLAASATYFGGTVSANNTNVRGHCLWHAAKRQVWWWWASSGSDPDTCVMLDVPANSGTGAWARYVGIGAARCSGLFAPDLVTVASRWRRDLKPFIGTTTNATLWMLDRDSTTDAGVDGDRNGSDAGTSYQAYVDLTPREPGGPGFYGSVGDAEVLARITPGTIVTLTVTAIADFATTVDSAMTQSASVSIATDLSATQTRALVRAQNTAFGHVRAVQYRVGDGSALMPLWTIDRLIVPYRRLEEAAA